MLNSVRKVPTYAQPRFDNFVLFVNYRYVCITTQICTLKNCSEFSILGALPEKFYRQGFFQIFV